MANMVGMTRSDDQGAGQQHFSCSAAAWDLLLEVGQSFGWKPAGTTYLPTRIKETPDPAVRHGYRPGDQRDRKVVTETDALAWARALSAARRSPHLEAMLDRHPVPTMTGEAADPARNANAPFISVMDEFIEYAFSGAFSFATAD